jgi:uncharacterized membrane protein (DUF4010 family)
VKEFQHLALALGLGLIVGIQREWASKYAGIRSFPLITLLGALSAMAAIHFDGWVIAAAMVALAMLIIFENYLQVRAGRSDIGITTDAAAFVMFFVGVILALDYTASATAVAGTVALLLHWKKPLHGFVKRIGEEDVQAIMRLILIALVILPLLPNRAFDPFGVINPFKIWLMVVLIVGISLGAYMAYKLLGARGGILLGGILGGLISSTATTVSYARNTRQYPETAPAAAVAIFVASTVVFGRVIFEIAVVAPELLSVTVPPLLVMMALMALANGVLFLWTRPGGQNLSQDKPPSDMKAAIGFGLLYAVVVLAVAVGKDHFGERGLYGVAALSGLTDMDAITLSSAQLMQKGELSADVGWRLIMVGTMANLVFKGIAVAVLGNRHLAWRMAFLFAIALAIGGLILYLWPSVTGAGAVAASAG